MRKIAAIALALMTSAAVAGAQKVMMPTQTSNPAVRIGPPQDDFSKARRIDRDEAIKLVKEGKAVFVDVRPKESYDWGHIKGALSIPEAELMNRLKEVPPGRMIITYCA